MFKEISMPKVVVFRGKQVRKIIYNNEWWFSVADVVGVLTDSTDPRQYIKKMRQRDSQLDSNWGTICTPLEMIAQDGKKREVNCANTEGIFRIIQSIPSPKAEPFKRWLAKVGYDRIQEIENPELATKRTRALYKLKGYSDDWIEKRMRGIAIREELTDEWQERGAQEEKDDDFELIFTMLGERSTTEIHRTQDSKGVHKLKKDAKAGGDIAGGARKQLEKRLNRSIVSKRNFLANQNKIKVKSSL